MELKIINVKEELKSEIKSLNKEIELLKKQLKEKEDKAFALSEALQWIDTADDTKIVENKNEKSKKTRNKSIIRYDKDGQKKKYYASIKEASKDTGWSPFTLKKFMAQPKDVQIKDRNEYYEYV